MATDSEEFAEIDRHRWNRLVIGLRVLIHFDGRVTVRGDGTRCFELPGPDRCAEPNGNARQTRRGRLQSEHSYDHVRAWRSRRIMSSGSLRYKAKQRMVGFMRTQPPDGTCDCRLCDLAAAFISEMNLSPCFDGFKTSLNLREMP